VLEWYKKGGNMARCFNCGKTTEEGEFCKPCQEELDNVEQVETYQKIKKINKQEK